MSTLLLIFKLIGAVTIWPFLFGYIQYRTSVKGSHRRYIARTILRPLVHIIPVYFAIMAFVRLVDHDYFFLVCDLYNTYWTSKFVKEFHSDDDDDWWSKTGKKLRRWAKSKAQALKPQILVPIPVGAR